MLNSAEFGLLGELGKLQFCQVPTDSQGILYGVPIHQNQAFLLTDKEFIWFVEAWEIKADIGKGRLQNKKLYPAKVTGLKLPSFWNSAPFSVSWQDGLVYGFQPGFGQEIPADTNRPYITVPPITRNAPVVAYDPIIDEELVHPLTKFPLGAFGRLLSIAAWVDPKIAKEYDKAPKGKKKPESPNKIDYDEFPVNYPPYDIAKNPYYY